MYQSLPLRSIFWKQIGQIFKSEWCKVMGAIANEVLQVVTTGCVFFPAMSALDPVVLSSAILYCVGRNDGFMVTDDDKR